MLPKPDTEQLGWRTLPWACLAFFLAYLTIFLVFQRDESQKQLELAQWYQQSGLFELEWENYISWLRISGQVAKAEELEAAKQDKDTLTVFRAMAFDPSFERENRLRGDQYWNVDQRIAWENTREQFRQRADSLPSVRFGLNPQAPRPSTYLSWHFLHDSWVQWLVALLVVLPFAWATEGTLGSRRMAIAWMSSGIVSGLVYVAAVSWAYQPLIGSTAIAAAVIGMYLGLFGIRKIPFIYLHPKEKQWRTLMLPAAVLAPLWLVLPLYEYFGGSSAEHVWLTQVVGLLAGLGIVQLVRKHEVNEEEVPEENDEEQAARQLRQRLTSGWASMSALSFVEASDAFNQVLASHPGHFDALSGLYQIHKLKPDSDDFHRIAQDVLRSAVDGEGEMRQQLALFKDYQKRMDDSHTLPVDVEVQLLMRFTRIGELKDAEQLAQKLNEEKASDPLLEKAMTQLGQAFAQYNATKAAHFAALAENIRLRQQRTAAD